MHIFDFIFQVFKSRLQLDQDEFTALRNAAIEEYNAATTLVGKFLAFPWLTVLPVVVLPLATKWVNNFLDRFFDDEDEDGDIDIADALAGLVEKLQRQKQLNA